MERYQPASFRAAWAEALSGKDLAKFEVLARAAFASAAQEALKLSTQLKKAIESGASEDVIRDLRQRLESAMSAATREASASRRSWTTSCGKPFVARAWNTRCFRAVSALLLAVRSMTPRQSSPSLDKLKADGVDTGRVLAVSFTKAINTADGQAAIDSLRGRIEQMRKVLGDKITDGLLDQARGQGRRAERRAGPGHARHQQRARGAQTVGCHIRGRAEEDRADGEAAYDTLTGSGTAAPRELGE
ncbi:hypothetical protein C8E08_5017, partial [Paracidovorax citrulli]